jgi:hypothetical protein
MAHGFLTVFGLLGIVVSPGILGRVRDDGLGVSVWFGSAGASAVSPFSGFGGCVVEPVGEVIGLLGGYEDWGERAACCQLCERGE